MEKQFKARLVHSQEIAHNTYELRFGFGVDTFEFKAGQYVWLDVPKLLYEDPRGSRRAFSISSSPCVKGSIEIIFRLTGSGFKKTLIDKRSIGRTFEVIGPFGFLGIPGGTEKSLVFIAGGVGVAPYVSIAKYASENGLKNKITLIFSNSSPRTSFYVELFKELASKNPNFKFVNNIGRLDASVFKENVADIKNSLFYVTGPKDFVGGISSELLSLGVPRGNFVFEEFRGFPTEGTLSKVYANGRDVISLKEFRTAVVDVADHIVVTDADGFIRYANPAAEKITGFSFEEMKGNTPRLWGGLMDGDFYEKMWKTIKVDKKTFEVELQNRRKNGEVYYAIARISPVLDDDGILTGFVATEEDITKIKELDRMKDEFVSIASHELRTPLTAIDGIVSMMQSGEYGPINESLKQPLEDMTASSERLIHLVNDLLDLSRIQAGRMKYTLSNFPILDAVYETVQLLQSVAKQKNIRLDVAMDSEKGVVQADVDKVKQILNNLIGNALKFTDRGSVTVLVKIDGDKVKIYVSDTGIGIAKEDQTKIFGKFQQLKSDKGRPEGTGLGLHISKEMVNKMGGDLWIEESEKDVGSVFAFSLPKAGSKLALKIKSLVY